MGETGAVWTGEVTRVPMLESKRVVYEVSAQAGIFLPLSTENIPEPPRRLAETDAFALFLFPAPFPLTVSSSPEESSEQSTASNTSPSLAKPCDALFEHLARVQPDQLIRLIRSGDLGGADLASAAEIAGIVSDSKLVVPALLPLLRDPLPMVREAAVCGLSNHLTEEVRSELARVSETDPSAAVRETAASVLDE